MPEKLAVHSTVYIMQFWVFWGGVFSAAIIGFISIYLFSMAETAFHSMLFVWQEWTNKPGEVVGAVVLCGSYTQVWASRHTPLPRPTRAWPHSTSKPATLLSGQRKPADTFSPHSASVNWILKYNLPSVRYWCAVIFFPPPTGGKLECISYGIGG